MYWGRQRHSLEPFSLCRHVPLFRQWPSQLPAHTHTHKHKHKCTAYQSQYNLLQVLWLQFWLHCYVPSLLSRSIWTFLNVHVGYRVGTLTVLALVTQEVRGAAAGWLVSGADCAVASIFAVILTGVQVTVWPRKACQASTGRRACGRTDIWRDS